jgi:hypothetical protein
MKKRTVETMTVVITWVDGTVEEINATSCGIASLLCDPCIESVEVIER